MAASTNILEAHNAEPAWAPEYSALEEERREVFESVAEAARRPGRDADCAAACAFLLRHLASMENRRTSSDIM